MGAIRGRPKKHFVDAVWLRDVYEVQKRPHGEIAAQIGCHPEHLRNILATHGIQKRDGRRGRISHGSRVTFDLDYATVLYVDRKWNCDQIGGLLGVHGCTIRRRLREAGVKIRHHNDTKRGKTSRNRIQLDADTVISAYREPLASVSSVAKKMGVSNRVVQRVLDQRNEPIKPIGEIRQWKGDSHPRWRHDLTDLERSQRRDINAQAEWRMRVYMRDHFSCQKCGHKSGNNLHAHHIEPHYRSKHRRWDTDNGITLCADCHRQYHRIYGFKRANRETFTAYLAGDNDAKQLCCTGGRLGKELESRC